MGVEGGEQSAANDTYSGRLTADFLVERIGHKFFEHVSELDLSSQKIRDVGEILVDRFFEWRKSWSASSNLRPKT
jgi:hypothetical protein